MKLITARQAWHDAYYNGSSSPLARAVEIGRLGTHIQMTKYHDSNNRAAHVAQCGRVQHAISTLPEELQKLGHWLYAPLLTEEANCIVEDVQDYIFGKSGIDPKNNKAYWLTRAVMSDYQDVVLGREQRLKKAKQIREYLADWYGIEIKTNQWTRDWAPKWLKLWHALNDLDVLTLSPIAAVVYQSRAA